MPDTDDVAARWRRKISRLVMTVLACSAVAFVLSAWAMYSIQRERENSVRTSCQQQNERHDRTLVALDDVLNRARAGADARRLAQIKQSRASTTLLIEALAPRQDCEQRVRTLVGAGILPFLIAPA